MASLIAKVIFRTILVALLFFFLFYVGRPLYWKISATIHDIHQNEKTLAGELSEIMFEAQKSVGWYHDDDESDSGFRQAL